MPHCSSSLVILCMCIFFMLSKAGQASLSPGAVGQKISMCSVVLAAGMVMYLMSGSTFMENMVSRKAKPKRSALSKRPKRSAKNAEPLREGFDSAAPTNKTMNAEDLLPADESNAWTESNPKVDKVLPGSKNYLVAGEHLGMQNSVNRNPNMSLRSDPYIPKDNTVSPWLISTMEADKNRRGLEINASCEEDGSC